MHDEQHESKRGVRAPRWSSRLVAELAFVVLAISLPLAQLAFAWPGGAWWVVVSIVLLLSLLGVKAANSRAAGWESDFAMEHDDPGSERTAMPLDFFDPEEEGFVRAVLVCSPTGFQIYTAPYVFHGSGWDEVKSVTIDPNLDVCIEIGENPESFRIRPIELGTSSAAAGSANLFDLLSRWVAG